jgi:hypothetical protein
MITLLSSAAASSAEKHAFHRDFRRLCAIDRSVAAVDTDFGTGIDINVDIGVAVQI